MVWEELHRHSALLRLVAAEYQLRHSSLLVVLPFAALHFSITGQGETKLNIYQTSSTLPHVEWPNHTIILLG